MICFYYGLTAFACVWFFRNELFNDLNSIVFKFLLPLLGGLGLTAVLLVTLSDSFSPDYGSGAEHRWGRPGVHPRCRPHPARAWS